MQRYEIKYARYRVISSFIDFYRVVRLQPRINLVIPHYFTIFASSNHLLFILIRELNYSYYSNSFLKLCITNKPITPLRLTVPHLLSVTFRISCPSQPGPSSADGFLPTPASNPSLPPDPALSPPPRSPSSSPSSGNRKAAHWGLAPMCYLWWLSGACPHACCGPLK